MMNDKHDWCVMHLHKTVLLLMHYLLLVLSMYYSIVCVTKRLNRFRLLYLK